MKVILLQNVKNLGQKGEVKEVSDGYARNFLFPKNMAKAATAEALETLLKKKVEEEAKRQETEKLYQEIAKKLDRTIIIIGTKTGDGVKTFGAVTAARICEALAKEKIDIRKEWLVLERPLKTTGMHNVEIRFPGGIRGMLRLNIQPEK